jgi:hypothetical protein
MKNIAINLLLVLLIIASLIGAFKTNASVEAQPQQEVKPYQVGEFEVPMQMTAGKIYKTVHEGCELYIATASAYGKDPSVSITTGRGCK